MKDEKHIYKPGYDSTQYIDELTTAERSVVNARRLDTIDILVENIADVVQPTNVLFGDGTLVNTQATRAEDIVSVEDVRLQGEIDGKVNIASYVVEQDAQDSLIASNTADIASNDTDIANLQSDVAVIESEIDVINQELIAQAAFDVASTAKDIQQDGRLDNVEAKDIQQDNRLDILEGEIGQVGVTSSIYNDTVATFSSTTPTTITPSITTDFAATSIAENDFVDQAPMSVVIKQASQVRFDFNYTLEQITGTAVNFTVDLYNVTQAKLIDTNTVTFDFSGSVNQLSGNQFNLGEVAAGDVITVMVYVDTGTVAIPQAKGLFTITTLASTGSDTIYDYNVISSSEVGGATTLEDINYLNANKADKTELANKADLTYVDAQDALKVDLDKGGNVVITQTPNEFRISDRDNPTDNFFLVRKLDDKWAIFGAGTEQTDSRHLSTVGYVDDNFVNSSKSTTNTVSTIEYRGAASSPNLEVYQTTATTGENQGVSIRLEYSPSGDFYVARRYIFDGTDWSNDGDLLTTKDISKELNPLLEEIKSLKARIKELER